VRRLGSLQIAHVGGKARLEDIVLTLKGERLTLQELFDRLSKLTAEAEGQVKDLVSDKKRLETGIRKFLAGEEPQESSYGAAGYRRDIDAIEDYFEALLKKEA
jgi:hypothetical protein